MVETKFVQLDVKNRAFLQKFVAPGQVYSLTTDRDGVIVLTLIDQESKED